MNYFYNFGSLLGLFLAMQILSGFFLTLFYKADLNESFSNVIHLMNNVNSGWMIRFMHSTGASLFFVFFFFHIGKAFYYFSFFYWKVWLTGLIMILFFMLEAFLGYVLPWGQMSLWGATVITNLISVIPYFGQMMVEWLWGGFNVGGPTLTRFFSFHFILPFIVLVMVILHLFFLHEMGSSNPLGVSSNLDKCSFSKFFIIKDLLLFIMFMLLFFMLSLKTPFFFMDSENFIIANPMLTPPHIQPEWYFLFAYSILRSIPNKLGGVMMLVASIFIIIIFPLIRNSVIKSSKFFPTYKFLFFMHIGSFGLLTWLGMKPVEFPFTMAGKIFSLLYFIYYLL